MNRKALAVAVIAVWLAALGWLARRELWQSSAAVVAEAALSLPPGAAYYTISVNGRQLGYASTTIDTLGDTLRLSELVVIEIPVAGDTQRSEVRTDVQLSRALLLRDFATTVRGDEGRFVVRGAVEGDSVLALRVTGAGAETGSRIRTAARPVWLSQLLALNIALGGELVPGRVHATRILDPVHLDPADATITVAAESTLIVADSAVFDSVAGRFMPIAWDTLQAWALQIAGPGPARTVWVDEHGLPVLETTAGGFRVERSAFEIAYDNFRRLGERSLPDGDVAAGPVVRRTVGTGGVSPGDRPLSRLTLRLGGRPLEGLALDGDRQRLAGDTLYIERERPGSLTSEYRLPIGRREMAPYVRPAPLIQSADPRIQAQARQVIGRTRAPEVAAERLVRWVYESLARDGGAGGPSALDVLETRRGDSNDHTVLFTAMARGIGLPTRIVTGLVYRDGLFYYHAWPEVYLGDWVAVDPTFGQFPADAGRVRLAIGGLARQLELARLAGGLTIDVLSADQGG